jgi:hypothetical protein
MATINWPQTGSIIQGPQGQDATFTGLSTNIVIKVGGTAVGAIQSISVREQRNILMIDEVGTDGHIDSTPSKSTDISGECRRTRFDRLRVAEAFSRDFLHVHAQRIPFDIDIYDNWNGDGSNAIITTIRNVWIQSISYQYQSENFVIIDDMAFVAETIYSTLNGSNAATGGLLGSSILQQNPIELQSDVGARRGSLDAPGLISDFFTNV